MQSKVDAVSPRQSDFLLQTEEESLPLLECNVQGVQDVCI